ncbi:Mitochondrial inner membrane protein oxa1l [Phlyctochytrium bullatum]|nr:Mitochondrial inner membrane protein oxa1l [Phlyctochytrium bullatum]
MTLPCTTAKLPYRPHANIRSFWSFTKPAPAAAPNVTEAVATPPPPPVTPPLNEVASTPSLIDPSISKDFVGSLNTVLTPDVTATAVSAITEVTKFGDLKALGLCHNTPVGLAQYLLEAVHVTTGLPWWGTIVAATVLIRVALFPIVVKTQRNAAKLQKLKPQLEPFNEQLALARKLGDQQRVQSLIMQMRQIYKDGGTSPFSVFWGLVQAPVFLSFFFALRGMAELPVPGFMEGGLLFVKDLTVMDPTYIMPIVASLTMLAVMEMSTEAQGGAQHGAQSMKTVFRAMILLFIPVTASLPSAIFMYWVPSNFFTLIQFMAMKNPTVKKALNIPHVEQPKLLHKPAGMSAFSAPSYSASFSAVREALKRRKISAATSSSTSSSV